jgi:MFS family permease
MKQITLNFPSKISEIEPWCKKLILSYDNWAVFFFSLTVLSLAVGQMGDSTQSDQRWTLAWGVFLFLWSAFLVFCGKSADLNGRRWWVWMLTAFFLPFISIFAALIFRTSNQRSKA